jgi:hypothetical protein
MVQARRTPKPAWAQALAAIVGLVFFLALYVALMRLQIDVSRLGDAGSADHRDRVYFVIHAGLIAGAAVGGFLLGKWLSGLGLAYAALFVVVVSVSMVGVQFGSFELACRGHNDLIRHWSC